MSSYKIGDQIRISLKVLRLGVKTDPSSLQIRIKTPSNSYLVYSEEIEKTAVGEYYFDLSLTESGTWKYRWETTGAAAGADEGSIYVEKSSF